MILIEKEGVQEAKEGFCRLSNKSPFLSHKIMKNQQRLPENCGTVGEGFDPRVRRTRQLLEDAFRVLVEEKSLEALSVQDITDHATINRATFYAHYNDKYDLAASVLRRDLRKAIVQKLGEGAPLMPTTWLRSPSLFLSSLNHCTEAARKPLRNYQVWWATCYRESCTL